MVKFKLGSEFVLVVPEDEVAERIRELTQDLWAAALGYYLVVKSDEESMGKFLRVLKEEDQALVTRFTFYEPAPGDRFGPFIAV